MARIDFVTGNAQRYLPDVETLAAIPDRVEALLAGRSSAELRRMPAARDGQYAPGEEWSPARHFLGVGDTGGTATRTARNRR